MEIAAVLDKCKLQGEQWCWSLYCFCFVSSCCCYHTAAVLLFVSLLYFILMQCHSMVVEKIVCNDITVYRYKYDDLQCIEFCCDLLVCNWFVAFFVSVSMIDHMHDNDDGYFYSRLNMIDRQYLYVICIVYLSVYTYLYHQYDAERFIYALKLKFLHDQLDCR
jgi:hypothetical protein